MDNQDREVVEDLLNEIDEKAAKTVDVILNECPWNDVKEAFKKKGFTIVESKHLESQTKLVSDLGHDVSRMSNEVSETVRDIHILIDSLLLLIPENNGEEGNPEVITCIIESMRNRLFKISNY